MHVLAEVIEWHNIDEKLSAIKHVCSFLIFID
jgi:hypothetical protein